MNCPSPNFFLTIGQPPTKMKAMGSSNDFKPDREKRERERKSLKEEERLKREKIIIRYYCKGTKL